MEENKNFKKEYFKSFLAQGMQKIGNIPEEVLADAKMIKAMIAHETIVLSFLPDNLKKPQNFLASKPGRGRNVLVAMDSTNSFIPAKMLEQMVDEFNILLGYPYFKEEPKQFAKFSPKGKTTCALTFLIEGRTPPEYVKKYCEGYEGYSVEELKDIKDKLIFSKSMDKIVDKSLSKVDSSISTDNDSKFKL